MSENTRNDWKGDYKRLAGRLHEINEYKEEVKIFNSKILSIEKLHLFVAIVLVIVTCGQLYMFKQQNDKIEQQNELFKNQNIRLDQQTYLHEAERRGNLVFLFSNIMDAIDKELKEDYNDNDIRDLSPQLIGRIVSLSNRL